MGDTSDVRKVEKQRLDKLLFEEPRDKYTEVPGETAGDTLRVEHKAQNLGKGVTKARYVRPRWHSWKRTTSLTNSMLNGLT